MDGGSFDRLTRLLAGRLTRRSGAGAAVAGLLGLAGAADAAAAKAGAGAGAGAATGRAPGGEGDVYDEKRPCGPKARDNRCRKHKDCCTKYCRKPKKGSAAKIGRCRCIKVGKKCKGKQKCCGGATCQNRKCTPAAQPCVATVCASGCAFTDVNAAYAAAAPGDTIVIGPGSYPTGIVVDKSITLAGCPGATDVELVVDRQVKGADSYYGILVENPADTEVHSVVLQNLRLKGTYPANQDEALLSASDAGRIDFTLEDCAGSDAYYFIYVMKGGTHVLRRFTGTNYVYGVYYSSSAGGRLTVTLTVEDSQFSSGDESLAVCADFCADDAIVSVTGSTLTGTGIYYCGTIGSFTVTDTTITGFTGYYPLRYDGSESVLPTSTATIANVAIDDCEYGPMFYNGTVQVTDSAFTNLGDTYGSTLLFNTEITLTNTRIAGNKDSDSANLGGGGILAKCQAGKPKPLSVTFAGTTTVENNSTTKWGGGILLFEYGACTSTITNVSLANVKNNTATLGGPQCARYTSPGSVYADVPTCSF
ncbi:MAG: hypothetical protein ACKOWF_05405 [Chloroflexota bacterium]